MRCRVAWLSLAWAACAARPVVHAPEPSGDGTILIVYSESGSVRANVFRASSAWTLEQPFDPADLLWIEYANTPAELGLTEGLLPSIPAGEPSRDPSTPDRAALSRGGGPFSDLAQDVLANEALWRGLRWPAFGPRECIEAGGCFANDKCDLGCTPSVVAPVVPTLPAFVCPEGWTRGTLRPLTERERALEPRLEALGVCRPTFPSEPCPRGSAAFGDRAECEPLGDCLLEWAADLPADAVSLWRVDGRD